MKEPEEWKKKLGSLRFDSIYHTWGFNPKDLNLQSFTCFPSLSNGTLCARFNGHWTIFSLFTLEKKKRSEKNGNYLYSEFVSLCPFEKTVFSKISTASSSLSLLQSSLWSIVSISQTLWLINAEISSRAFLLTSSAILKWIIFDLEIGDWNELTVSQGFCVASSLSDLETIFPYSASVIRR